MVNSNAMIFCCNAWEYIALGVKAWVDMLANEKLLQVYTIGTCMQKTSHTKQNLATIVDMGRHFVID